MPPRVTRVRRTFAAALACLSSWACEDAGFPHDALRMIDVEGGPIRVATLELEERNPGEPVLVLFSGASPAMESWGDWITALSALAPVVAYDRPGLGGSPFDGVTPTPRRVAEHAHEVLQALEVPPPYVLVGHSWGGPLIRVYSGLYPSEVVGLVYLDPTDMTATSLEMMGVSSESELKARQAQLDSFRAGRTLPPGPEAENEVIRAFLRTPPSDRSLPAEMDVPTSVVLAVRSPPIPEDAPTYLTENWFDAMFSRRLAEFNEWVRHGPNRTLIVAENAGHFVFVDDPATATEAVASVLAAVRVELRDNP